MKLKYTDFGALNEEWLAEISSLLHSKNVQRETREFLATELRGQSLDAAMRILTTLREVGKPLGTFITQTAGDLLDLPLSEFQALLAGSVAKRGRRPAKTRATKATKAMKAAKPAKRAMKISPKRAAALKIQGRYIGLMRGAAASVKAKAKAATAKSGIKAGLKVILDARAAAVSKKPIAKKPIAKKPIAKKPIAKKPIAKRPASVKSTSEAVKTTA